MTSVCKPVRGSRYIRAAASRGRRAGDRHARNWPSATGPGPDEPSLMHPDDRDSQVDSWRPGPAAWQRLDRRAVYEVARTWLSIRVDRRGSWDRKARRLTVLFRAGGEIPDQLPPPRGRRRPASHLRADPGLADLPPLRPHWGAGSRPPSRRPRRVTAGGAARRCRSPSRPRELTTTVAIFPERRLACSSPRDDRAVVSEECRGFRR